MDKYEYRVKTEQLLEYTEKRQYQKAMEIADTIDWRRVKSASMLNTVSEIYEYCGEYQKSRDILFMAFDRSPGSRKIVYRLGTLALKINDVEEASDCYEEFIKLAPKDPNQYILKYKILKMQGAPLEEQIETLEEFKKAEYIEKWAYELAKLYHEAGMTRECLEECDDLILWFSEGKYVYLAMELKMKYKPLTPLQQEKYDRHTKGAGSAVSYEEPEETDEENDEPEEVQEEVTPEPAEEHNVAAEEAVEEETAEEEIQSASEPGIAAYTDKIIQEAELQEPVYEEPKEEPEEPVEPKQRHSAITRVVKGATLEEALASGVAIAAGINKEEKNMAEREEQLRISGQMRIEEILQEWEEKQKANADAIEKQKQEDVERLRKEREEAEKRREADRRAVEEAARRAQEEAARKAAEEEARRAAEEAARKAAEEAARKAAEEEAARKAAEEAARKAAEEAARKAAEEEAARKAAEEEAARKAAEEEAARKAAEEEAARKAAEEEAARKALEALDKKDNKKNVLEEKTQRLPDDIMELVEQLESRVAGNSSVSRNTMELSGERLEEEDETEEVEELDEADYRPEAIEDDFEDDFEEELEEKAEEVEEAEETSEDKVEDEVEEAFEEFDEEEFNEEAFDDEETFEEEETSDGEETFEEEETSDGEEAFDEDEFDEDDFVEEEEFDEGGFDEDDFREDDFEEDDFEEDDFDEEEFDEDDFEEDELDEDDFEEESEDAVENEFSRESVEKKEEPLEIEEPSEEEIQKRIKKSKGGGVPFDTGFVVTGRYDLSATSEIGLKAGLTEEQKKLFSYFVPVRGMSEQIVEVLDNDRRAQREGTSKTGNLLVIGRKGSGKTVLAVDIVKAIQKQRNLKQGKVAIVTGDSLNKKELTNIIQKLRGGAIIVEKAGKLNSRTIKELNHLMERKTGEMLFVLEDQRKPLERILTANPEFKKKFTSKLELPIFINDELVTFGQTYAKENGYKLDEMGILALYSRIDVMQREDHAVSVAEVKDIMDEAIAHSQRANVKHLARRVFGKSTDSSDRIILKEEDFKI